MFMVLLSWRGYCENLPGSFDECTFSASGHQPSDKANQLGL